LPIYTYACTACDAEIERRQSFSDPPLTTCESCGGSLRKVLHPAGVIFKGSGFYNTDYKKSTNGSSTNGAESKTDAKDGAAKSDSKSDSAATSDGGSSSSDTSKTPASSGSSDSKSPSTTTV
jgi:putative FmdB family regulatory protein